VLALLLLLSCIADEGQEPFDYARDTPSWLKEKISLMSSDTRRFYIGTKVYRYDWHRQPVYDIFIPLSSCAYCEVYDQSGNKIQFAGDAMLQDFLSNRTNELLVWELTTSP
jgi:hypothetical protein